jgi:antitoxin component of RelBE/YafQ-DinJ toxin-antitoxin module
MATPLLQPCPKRNVFFTMRVSREEREEIETLAEQLNMPMSHMVRQIVMQSIQTHKLALSEGAVDGK